MRPGLETLLRTTTFRLAVAQTSVVLLIVVALLAYVYVATVGQLVREADEAAELEFTTLERSYADQGLAALTEQVRQRAAASDSMLYLLRSARGEVLHQDILDVPRLPGEEVAHVEFEFVRRDGPGRRTGQGRGRFGPLLGGPTLLVIRDLGDTAELAARITSVLWSVGVLGVILSILGGLAASRQAARRVEAIAATARDVMEGDLSRRARDRGGGDEFDTLAQSINAMLDRLEKLVQTTRTAGDSIAHDLRSPLTRLRQRLEGALAAEPGGETERRALQSAIEEADRLLDTFQAVLRLSRVESVANWRLEPFDASEVVRRLVDFYEPAAEEGGISFAAQIDSRLIMKGEPQLITQAMVNLIENSLKYTPRGGRIEVRALEIGRGRIELSVSDDGPGVPEEDRDRVVERFVRLESSRSTSGSGLGLSLVSAVARLHRGALVLTDGLGASTSPGLRAALLLPMSA